MAGKFHHEQLFRVAQQITKLAAARVVLCGAGAVGSNLADNLVRQGIARLRVIDHDCVEEHNISTQLYGESEIGVGKVEALRARLFRATGVEIDDVHKELTERNARQVLKESDLVIDTFDNARSRRLVQDQCRADALQCLHIGLYADYCEVVWDERYRVPRDVAGDVCDYPLARNLVLLAVAIASEAVVRFVASGSRESFSATLADLNIQTWSGG